MADLVVFLRARLADLEDADWHDGDCTGIPGPSAISAAGALSSTIASNQEWNWTWFDAGQERGTRARASLARCDRPSAQALARWQAQRDPARRR
jgi:hypothetical protein